MKISKKLAVISLMGLFLFTLPFLALADENPTDSVYLGADEIIDGNYIKFGNSIEIASAVNGDVLVVGNIITISGPVAGDVIAAGNTIRIKGPVNGSVRLLAAENIEIDSEIQRNVWGAAKSIIITENAKVGWDVNVAGTNVEIKGQVGGNIWTGGESVVVGDKVGKNAKISLDTAGQLILLPNAKVDGDLVYYASSDNQLNIEEGALVGGEVVRDDVLKQNVGWPFRNRDFGMLYIMIKIISLFSMLVVGLLFMFMAPRIIMNVKDEMAGNPIGSIIRGLVFTLALPVVAILLMITIIGLPLALMIISMFFIGLYVSNVLAGFALGLFVVDRFGGKKTSSNLIWPLVIGLIIFIILSSIPFVGWLIKIILIWWALGALMKVKMEILKNLR